MVKVRLAILALTTAIAGVSGLAWAQPQVEILSPTAGECVNNGDEIFEGNAVGGQAQAPKRDFVVDLRLSDAQSRPLDVTITVATPVNRPPLGEALPCANDGVCAAAADGVCFPNGTCGCFVDQDCQNGARCNDNRCGCTVDLDCGAGERCLGDGRCGCGNDAACSAGESCTVEGVCTCDADADCEGAGQVCVDGTCALLEDERSFEYPGQASTPVPTPAQFSIGGESIRDDERKVLRVAARAGVQVGADAVSFKLDREAPTLELDLAFEQSRPACSAAPPNLNPFPGEILDGLDPAPTISSIQVVNAGCTMTQQIVVRDNCNNRQRLNLTTRRAPTPGQVSVDLQAYRCGVDGCAPNPANLLANGDRTTRATAYYDIAGPEGCTSGVQANYTIAGESTRILVPGAALETTPAVLRGFVGPYNFVDGQTLQVQVDGGPVQTVTFRAAEVRNIAAVSIIEAIRIINQQATGLIADVNLGIELRTITRGRTASLRIVGGPAGARLGLDPGAFTNGDGDGLHAVRVEVFACNGPDPIATDTVNFTILDRPVADAGGPYEPRQGEALMLTAEGSFAAPEVGGIVEYAWDLDGDGTYEIVGDAAQALRVPFDTAQGDGLYRVFLRIRAGDGAVEFTSALVNVLDVDPICSLGGAAPLQGIEGEPVEFDGSASAPGHPSDPILVYDWDFGDNLFPQRGDGLTHVSHQFPNQGQYTVRLRVEDPDSSAECTRLVNISDVSPVVRGVAAFNANNLVEGTPVRFTAGETAPGSPADPLTDLQWNFGDGTVINGLNRNPEHTYLNDGTYNVCLTVSDEDSQAPEFCFQVVIADLNPEPFFEAPVFGEEGLPVEFDATNTIAGGPADPLTRLVWNFGDGTPNVTINNPAAPGARRVTHLFAASGRFTVTLTAFDEDSQASFQLEVEVFDVQPTARAVVVYGNPEQVGYEGLPLTLDASASVAGSPTDPIARYRWNFGDGSPTVETLVPTVQHAWPNEGTYSASVTVIDSDGSEAVANLQVNVENVAPANARVIGPDQVEVGEVGTWRVQYDDVPADIPPATTRWTVNGEVVSSTLALETALGGLGEYVIGVQIADGAGATATAQLRVQVTPAAPIIQQVGPFNVREGQALAFEVRVTPALRNDLGERDGPVRIIVSRLPEGASYSERFETIDGVEVSVVSFEWTPTYYDAGTTEIRLVAEGRFNPTARSRDFVINVAEGGNPVLAAAGGTGRRGQVTLFDYARTAGVVTFTARARVDVGIGAGGVVAGPDGRYVFVATPGSGGVAVVGTREGALLRTVPTGPGTRAVVYGGDHVWALDNQAGNLTAIDPETLKIEATVRLGIDRPLDLAWLPAGFGGALRPRIVVTAGDGTISLIDPEAVLDEMPAIISQASLGGVLNRVVIDEATGELLVADGKTRMLYRFSAARLEDSPGNLDPEGTALVFAATDLVVGDGQIIAATDAGLMVVEGDERTTLPGLRAVGVAALPPGIIAGGSVVVSTADRVENLNGELTRIIDAAGGRVRRLAAFIAFQ